MKKRLSGKKNVKSDAESTIICNFARQQKPKNYA
jgi:hypothetical protein